LCYPPYAKPLCQARTKRQSQLTRGRNQEGKEVAEIIEAGFVDLEALEKMTALPKKPDYTAMDELIAKHYRQIIRAA
jgi:hypothetical protein